MKINQIHPLSSINPPLPTKSPDLLPLLQLTKPDEEDPLSCTPPPPPHLSSLRFRPFRPRASIRRRLARPPRTGQREGNQPALLLPRHIERQCTNRPSGSPRGYDQPVVYALWGCQDDRRQAHRRQDPNSTEFGRAQGAYSSASQGVLMTMYFSFTNGKYNGSSISILRRKQALRPVREIPVVGGSGLFRLARGVALARTYMFNATTGDAIAEYNVTVVHYEVTDDSRFELKNSDVSAAIQSFPLLCSSWFGLLVVASGVMINLSLP